MGSRHTGIPVNALTFGPANLHKAMHLPACLCVVLSVLEGVRGTCPSQCSCDALGRDNDDTEFRAVLCDDPDMTEVPRGVPAATERLRIEKTAVRRIPADAFYYLGQLRSLWVTCGALASLDARSFYNLARLRELRLDGNALAAFPWPALGQLPRLRRLVLRSNRLSRLPAEALAYLGRLALLDLSSNRLATLPPGFLDSWTPLHPAPSPAGRQEPSARTVILGLQDNPWLCDCHISRLIELSRDARPAVVLLDPQMTCHGPERLAGILFEQVELEQCQKPAVRISATQITSVPGSNVLLRCDASGQPTPQLMWARAPGLPLNHSVIQDSPAEGVRWSIISLTGISHRDAGDYKCWAKNLAGSAVAVVAVRVLDPAITNPALDPWEGTRGYLEPEAQPVSQRSSSDLSSSSTFHWPLASASSSFSSTAFASLSTFAPSLPSSVAFSPSPQFSAITSSTTVLNPGGERKVVLSELGRKKPSPASANRAEELVAFDGAMPVALVENLRVMSQTRQSVTLTWDPGKIPWTSEMIVLYSKNGPAQDLQPLNTDISQNQVTIPGLEAGQQYLACICPRGAPAQKHQCITFATEEGLEGSGPQGWALILASGATCVFVLPLLFFLLYKVCKLWCMADSLREDELAKETYIPFESLSPGSQSLGEFWTRQPRGDRERLLLCS